MGSAMAQVAAMRGHEVRLWGTWLDDDLVAAALGGRDHPRLKMRLDPRIAALRSPDLARALHEAEIVVHAVSSEGAVPVMQKARDHLPDVPIRSGTKGLLPAGAVDTTSLRYIMPAAPGR
jgi:glycerol-3-phosphate dehydrogenase (NAD(P)+)